jgi:hypothetical protein
MAKGALPTTKNNKVAVNSSDSNPDFLINKLTSLDGSVDISVGSCNCEIDLTVVGSGGFSEQNIKTTVVYGDFSTASTTNRISPVEFNGLPAGSSLVFYKIKHSESFTGGSVSASTLGINMRGGAPNDLTDNLDVFQSVGEFNLLDKGNDFGNTNLKTLSHDNTSDLYLTLSTTGDDIDQLTGGSADVWIKIITFI